MISSCGQRTLVTWPRNNASAVDQPKTPSPIPRESRLRPISIFLRHADRLSILPWTASNQPPFNADNGLFFLGMTTSSYSTAVLDLYSALLRSFILPRSLDAYGPRMVVELLRYGCARRWLHNGFPTALLLVQRTPANETPHAIPQSVRSR